jgi:hypothetical protein
MKRSQDQACERKKDKKIRLDKPQDPTPKPDFFWRNKIIRRIAISQQAQTRIVVPE